MIEACLMPGFDGETVPDWLRRAIEAGLGGVCLYGQNAGRIAELAAELRAQRPDLLVAVDEEGGDVTRLHYRDGSPFPGNLALGVVDDVELTRRVAAAIGGELAAAGVNVNLAPVCDVNSDPENPVIGVRSFGSDAELVARHGRAFVDGVQSAGVAAAAKHFPGHGATHADSHHELPVSDFDRRALVPFAAAIDGGVRAVLTAHVVFPELDGEHPATLSRRILTDLLRGELGFDGVVVTDALDMRAVSDRYGIAGAAVRALAAGADVLLLGPHDGERLCAEVRAAVDEALRTGELQRTRLEEAAARVAALRRAAGTQPRPEPRDSPLLGLEAARRAVHVEGALPLRAPPLVVELRAAANLAVGAAPWSLAEPLAELGFLAGSVQLTGDAEPPRTDAPLVVACRDAYRSPWQRAFLARVRPDVVVALGMPHDRSLCPDAAFVATYGAARPNARAAAERISGASR